MAGKTKERREAKGSTQGKKEKKRERALRIISIIALEEEESKKKNLCLGLRSVFPRQRA